MFYSQATKGFYSPDIHGSYFIEQVQADEHGATVDRRLSPDPDGPIADAVEITEAEYRALIEGQGQGKQIKPDEDGRPALVDPPPVPAAERRATAKRAIDTAAGSARARYVSAGQLVEEEYRLALQQTQAWRDAGSPAGQVPAAIQDWADAAGITAEQAATSIEQTAAAWESVLLQIRQVRLAGKAAVDAAGDADDFAAIAQPFIDQLGAMQP